MRNRVEEWIAAWESSKIKPFVFPGFLTAVGICCLFFPQKAISVLTVSVGVLLLLYGVAKGLYLLRTLWGEISLTVFPKAFSTGLCILSGMLLIFQPHSFMRMSMFIVGVLLLWDGGSLLSSVRWRAPRWCRLDWIRTAAGVVAVLFGLTLFCFPAVGEKAMAVLLGIALIYEAVSRGILPLIRERMNTPVRRNDYIVTDFTDRDR